MLAPEIIHALIPFALLLHAVAHAIALGGLLAQIVRGAPQNMIPAPAGSPDPAAKAHFSGAGLANEVGAGDPARAKDSGAQNAGGSASRVLVRSWLLPSLTAKAAAAAALPFWLVATLGFAGASMVFDGILAGGEAWRQVAVIAALVSLLGSALFSGIWPGAQNASRSILNTSISLAMNIAILVSQLWLHWPPPAAG